MIGKNRQMPVRLAGATPPETYWSSLMKNAHNARIALVTAFLVSISACDKSADTGSQASQPTPSQAVQQEAVMPAQPAATPQPQEFYVGDTVTNDGLQITLDAVKIGTSINSSFANATAAEGGEYVVVIVRLKNVGSKPISSFEMPSLRLLDTNGNKYRTDVDASIAAATVFGDDSKVVSDLNPGIGTKTVDAFEVSKTLFNTDSWNLQVGDVQYRLVARATASAAPTTETAPAVPAAQADTAASAAQTEAAQATQGASTTSSAGCTDLDSCIAASLDAAKQENLDAVRSIASVIDGFHKPDLGNKTVAADLNARALAAIQQNDYAAAEPLLSQAYKENPRSAEITANYGLVLTRQGNVSAAIPIFDQAILLDPRRTSNWVPFADALVAANRWNDAIAALWLGWQWSSNRDKAISFYTAQSEAKPPEAGTPVYAAALAWVKDGVRPDFTAH